jgi:hypothetical protein
VTSANGGQDFAFFTFFGGGCNARLLVARLAVSGGSGRFSFPSAGEGVVVGGRAATGEGGGKRGGWQEVGFLLG